MSIVNQQSVSEYATDELFVSKLIDHKFPIDLVDIDSNRNNIIHIVIGKLGHNTELVIKFLNYISLYDSKILESAINSNNIYGNTPLYIAVMDKLDSSIIEKLKKIGAKVNKQLNMETFAADNNDNSFSLFYANLATTVQPKITQPAVDDIPDIVSISSTEVPTAPIVVGQPTLVDTISATSPTKVESTNSGNASEKIDTEKFLNFIKTQQGGKRIIKHDSDSSDDNIKLTTVFAQNNEKKKKYSSKRSSSHEMSPSNVIHNEVIDMIKNMGYSEEDARYIKAGLWETINKKYKDTGMSNMQRSIKMKELTTQDEVKNIVKILPELKEKVTKARELRKLEKEKNQTEQTENVKEPKKTKKGKKKETETETSSNNSMSPIDIESTQKGQKKKKKSIESSSTESL